MIQSPWQLLGNGLDWFKHHFILIAFFGQEAIRLLRETWEGVVNVQTDQASGQQQVRPVGADLLAQEMFSMLNDQTPQTNNAPVTINQPNGGRGLTINGQSSASPALHVTGGDVNLATSGSISIGQSSSATGLGSNITLSGNQIAIPPIGVIQIPATGYNALQPGSLPIISLATSAGPIAGQAYMGKVISSSGSGLAAVYTMELAGVTGTVAASIAETVAGYVVPNGTWSIVVAVQTGTAGSPPTYYFQPFPYATQTISGPLQAPSTLHNVIIAMANFGLFVDSTTSTPPTISGPTQVLAGGPTGGGALTNLLIGLSNLGIIVNSTTDSPQAFGPSTLQVLGTGGVLYDLCVALNNLGITSANVQDNRQTISGSRAGNPALQHLLTALDTLQLIQDTTTP